MQKLVAIITGPRGSGKTRLAWRLAETFGLDQMAKDTTLDAVVQWMNGPETQGVIFSEGGPGRGIKAHAKKSGWVIMEITLGN